MAVLTSLVACLALALSANPAASQMLLLEDHAADNTPEQAKPTKTHHGSSGQHGHHGSHTSGSGKHHAQEGDSQQSQHSGKHKPNFFPRGPIFVSPSLSEDGGRVEAEARIMGGEVVTTTYPWIASLQQNFGDGTFSHVCGASLVAPDFVLTAAHCTKNVINRVCVGGTQLEDVSEFQCFEVAQFIPHPDFSRADMTNDIQLIQLARKTWLAPIALSDTPLDTQPGRSIMLLGWGMTEASLEGPSPVLRSVSMEVADRSSCDVFEPPIPTPLPQKQFCDVGIKARSSCEGDSGGPAFTNAEPGQERLVGLVSFGSGDCSKGLPSIYTDVYKHKSWIESYTKPDTWQHVCEGNSCGENGQCGICLSSDGLCNTGPRGQYSCLCTPGWQGELCNERGGTNSRTFSDRPAWSWDASSADSLRPTAAGPVVATALGVSTWLAVTSLVFG